RTRSTDFSLSERRLVDPTLGIPRLLVDVHRHRAPRVVEEGEEVEHARAAGARPADVVDVLARAGQARDASRRQKRVRRLADAERPAFRRTGVLAEDVAAAHARLAGDAQDETVLVAVVVSG